MIYDNATPVARGMVAVMRRAAFLLIAVSLPLSAVPAAAQDPAQIGRALVTEHCSACHAVGRHGASPHRAAPPFRRLGRSYDLDDFPRLLTRGISATHPDMPEVKFDDEAARAVRAYLRTIQE